MRYQGKVTRWKDEQGFGFIVPNGGGEAVFLHIKSFSRRGRRPVDGEIVTYDLVFDGKARARAQSVAFVDESAIVPRGKSDAVWLLMALVSMAFVVHAAWLGKLPKLAPAIYVVASLFAYGVRLGQVGCPERGVANPGKYAAFAGAGRWLAGCLVCPEIAASQIEEDIIPGDVLGDGLGELRCAGLVDVAPGGGSVARLVIGGLIARRNFSFLTDFSC
jgi:cold shock CspA family protein